MKHLIRVNDDVDFLSVVGARHGQGQRDGKQCGRSLESHERIPDSEARSERATARFYIGTANRLSLPSPRSDGPLWECRPDAPRRLKERRPRHSV